MANFHDPGVIAQDALAMTKLWHTVSGLYIWEFVTTLGYEWSVIRGRLPYRRTIWVYSLARLAALMCVVLGLILLDNRSPINCQAAFSFGILASFVSTAASSLLIVLRIIAIWNKNRVAMAVAIGAWGIDVAFLIVAAARLRATWIPTERGCFPINGGDNAPNLVVMLVTDVVLLLIMLSGLLRLRQEGRGEFGLTQLLWKQGVIWLLVATIAEVLPVVFILMKLNEPFDAMFQQPSYITMAIAATRMHRSLVDFASKSNDVYGTPPTIRDGKCISAASHTRTPMEVAMHVISEQHCHGIPGTSDNESGISTYEQMDDKLRGLSCDDDLERGVYK